MAILVCCPCGNPLDCDNLEIVLTLTCPKCGEEISLEVEDAQGARLRAVLTLMEGPHWVGEQFVIPLESQLTIGNGTDNWLSLDSDEIAKEHCRLQLSSDGRVAVEDLATASGTWIGAARIVQGRLKPGESLTLGEYRFRLDLRQALGGAEAPQPDPTGPTTQPLPDLASVVGFDSVTLRLVRNRFRVARLLIWAFAWLSAAFHAAFMRTVPIPPWDWSWSALAGLIPLGVLIVVGRRVTLDHRYFKYVAAPVLLLLAILDAAWLERPLPPVAAMLLAAALPLLIIRTPSPTRAVFAVILGAAALLVMLVLALKHVLLAAGV
jgi:hypothetical protein